MKSLNIKVPISIIYPTDVFGSKIGGIDSFIKGFIKYAPGNFEIELVGISEDQSDRPVGRRMKMELGDVIFINYPVLYEADPNIRSCIPLIIKYTIALLKHSPHVKDRILEFHRLEPAILFMSKANKKLFFSHGNIKMLYNPMVEMKWGKFPWLYFLMEKQIIKGIEKTFVVNKNGLEYYKKIYPYFSDRFQFFPTWVDDGIFFPYSYRERMEKRLNLLHKMGLSSDSQILLFSGRLENPKNPMLLLETFKIILGQNKLAKLLIIGDGSLKTEMINFAICSNISKAVHFLGTLRQEDLADIMRISDLFILTSSFEGMPMSVLESLACGLPVVSTDVGGVNRFVKENHSGIVVREHRSEVIARAVLKFVLSHNPPHVSNCVNAVKPYFVKNVLEPLYNFHYQLIKTEN